MKPLSIDIWSDFGCPFCYIGKRNLEAALARFPERERVRVVWRSFQLDPTADRDRTKTVYQRLAEKYGRDLDWARRSTGQIAAMAAEAGLAFDFDRVVPANTLLAHQLAHAAARRGRQDAAEERLMKAHFTDGLDLADPATLVSLGEEIGLTSAEAAEALRSDDLLKAVLRDEADARALGVRAVPFFLLNRSLPVSGAQPLETFLAALESAAADLR